MVSSQSEASPGGSAGAAPATLRVVPGRACSVLRAPAPRLAGVCPDYTRVPAWLSVWIEN